MFPAKVPAQVAKTYLKEKKRKLKEKTSCGLVRLTKHGEEMDEQRYLLVSFPPKLKPKGETGAFMAKP